MTVKDIIKANDKDIEIIIEGKNALDDCDGFVEYYYQGKLGDVPEEYHSCIVLRHGYSLGFDCSFIAIPFLKQNDLVDPDEFEEPSSLLQTDYQCAPEYDETSEQDNTVENRTCETCKYRNIYYRCDMHSSHMFNRDLKYDYSCIFYVNKKKYNDIFRESD